MAGEVGGFVSITVFHVTFDENLQGIIDARALTPIAGGNQGLSALASDPEMRDLFIENSR
jgi:hypothetical protein